MKHDKKERDIRELIWAYNTFHMCVPKEYQKDISILVGKYYQTHLMDDVIEKVLRLSFESKDKTIDGQIKYVKNNWNI